MFDMLQCEAYNLRALAETNTLTDTASRCIAERPVHTATCCLNSLSCIQVDRVQSLGQQLARLHQHTEDHFGWPQDNWIGSTTHSPIPVARTGSRSWRHRRLAHQLDLAKDNHAGCSLLESGETPVM